MRLKPFFVVSLCALLAGATLVQAQQSEQEIVDQYLAKATKMHTQKLGWVSASFSFNRINRNNGYNDFANTMSTQFQDASWSWIGDGKILALEFGSVFKDRFAWSLGGEYWLQLGEELSGTYTYDPPLGASMQLTDPASEVQVYGFYTSFQVYFMNAPRKADQLQKLALRGGATIGYYMASWKLWDQYENLNLSTSLPEGENISYKGNAPGISLTVGLDYPVNFWGMVLGADVGYQYLNFSNMSWYNNQDQEIVVSMTGDEEGRVDLDLSGFRGKFELKRFFSW